MEEEFSSRANSSRQNAFDDRAAARPDTRNTTQWQETGLAYPPTRFLPPEPYILVSTLKAYGMWSKGRHCPIFGHGLNHGHDYWKNCTRTCVICNSSDHSAIGTRKATICPRVYALRSGIKDLCGSGDEIVVSALQFMPGQKDARILSEQFGYNTFTEWPYFHGQAPPGQITELKLRYIPVWKRGFEGDQNSRNERQATDAARVGNTTRADAEPLPTPATPATPAPNPNPTMDQGTSYQQGFREGYQRGWDDARNRFVNQGAWNLAPQNFNSSSEPIPNDFQFRGNEDCWGRNKNFEDLSNRRDQRHNNDRRANRPLGLPNPTQQDFEEASERLKCLTRDGAVKYDNDERQRERERANRRAGLPTYNDGHNQPRDLVDLTQEHHDRNDDGQRSDRRRR